MQSLGFQGLTKGHILHCEMCPFTLQKGTNGRAKGAILQHKRKKAVIQQTKKVIKRCIYV